ncbi:hypothetical protein CSUB01_06767 [Colletotrichum sublineola]|uniref:Zn(2)-C6 fungal-type domain-containing protein n=1 Tax=Colletotrichum sublineola TaxID=1173701 RepID=A0A066XBG0_COLSU|nr:hypothetical protein CSUB01_06767 [Colletotrichum sublineola]
MSSTGLAKTASRPKSNRDSINSKPLESKNIKIAVAAYSIQRRVLETLHDVLQANLREDHAMDLWGFKRSLRDHAVRTRTKRHLESARASCITGYNCFNEPASYEECVLSACTFVYQKLAIAKFMVLQAKERTAAAKECKEQLNGLRKEFGDCIVLEKNGGIREVDCASEQRALLAEWGLANTKTENSGRKWEDDLRDMVRLSVSREREEKVFIGTQGLILFASSVRFAFEMASASMPIEHGPTFTNEKLSDSLMALQCCYCDRAKPSCNRCQLLGKPCPGYADRWVVTHRPENVAAAHQVELRIAKRLRERERDRDVERKAAGSGGSGATSPAPAVEEIVSRRSAMPKPLQIDSELSCLGQFHSNYACGGEIALFRLMAGFKTSGTTSGVFDEALRATAFASSAVRMRQVRLMAPARRHYDSAVAMINSALRNPATAQDNSVVVALLTLSIYEALVPEMTPRKVASHCRDSLVLLRHRADQGVASSLDSGLLAYLAHLGLLEIFLGAEGRYMILNVLKNASWTTHDVVEPLLARAVEFKKTVDSVTSSIQRRNTPITEILQTGLDIIRDLEAAANYKIMSPGPRRTAQQEGAVVGELNNFNNLLSRSSYASEAVIKGLYLTVRLHIIEYIMGLSIALGEPTYEELSILTSLPHGLTALEQICEQIRVVFGFDGREPASMNQGIGFKAWCMFWPMIAVLKSGFTDKDTKLWVMDKCSLVSQASGFGMAMYEMGWFGTNSVRRVGVCM